MYVEKVVAMYLYTLYIICILIKINAVYLHVRTCVYSMSYFMYMIYIEYLHLKRMFFHNLLLPLEECDIHMTSRDQ